MSYTSYSQKFVLYVNVLFLSKQVFCKLLALAPKTDFIIDKFALNMCFLPKYKHKELF